MTMKDHFDTSNLKKQYDWETIEYRPAFQTREEAGIKKLIAKAKMSQHVISDENIMYQYIFEDGTIKYLQLANVQPLKVTIIKVD